MPYESYDAWKLASPPDPPEETPLEAMDRCVHRDACQMVWERFVDASEYFGKDDEMARALGCGEGCGCWEEA